MLSEEELRSLGIPETPTVAVTERSDHYFLLKTTDATRKWLKHRGKNYAFPPMEIADRKGSRKIFRQLDAWWDNASMGNESENRKENIVIELPEGTKGYPAGKTVIEYRGYEVVPKERIHVNLYPAERFATTDTIRYVVSRVKDDRSQAEEVAIPPRKPFVTQLPDVFEKELREILVREVRTLETLEIWAERKATNQDLDDLPDLYDFMRDADLEITLPPRNIVRASARKGKSPQTLIQDARDTLTRVFAQELAIREEVKKRFGGKQGLPEAEKAQMDVQEAYAIEVDAELRAMGANVQQRAEHFSTIMTAAVAALTVSNGAFFGLSANEKQESITRLLQRVEQAKGAYMIRLQADIHHEHRKRVVLEGEERRRKQYEEAMGAALARRLAREEREREEKLRGPTERRAAFSSAVRALRTKRERPTEPETPKVDKGTKLSKTSPTIEEIDSIIDSHLNDNDSPGSPYVAFIIASMIDGRAPEMVKTTQPIACSLCKEEAKNPLTTEHGSFCSEICRSTATTINSHIPQSIYGMRFPQRKR